MRHIVMTPKLLSEARNRMLKQFEAKLKDKRLGAVEAITLTFNPNEVELDEPVVINFSGKAWAKQQALVTSCTSEIAWHGTVKTDEKRKYFEIDDILVYPQSVTGVTVTTDEKKYQEWKNSLDDKTYNSLRFQAHSHVNMATGPSGVDRTLYNNILQAMGTSSFYLFMIINKRGDMHIEIYDLQNNAIYTNEDIVVMVETEDMEDWYEANYKEHIATYAAKTTHAPVNPVTNYPAVPGGYYDNEYFEDQYRNSRGRR